MPNFGARWKVVDKMPIGKGGQSHAYLVSDASETTNKQYIAKVLNGADDPVRRQRLESEIQKCKEFDHPNVVQFIDSGHTENSNYPFLVLPFYEHRSLAEYRQKLPTDPAEILKFFAKICDGVAHVHSKGIVHRDIKPANIFVSAEHEPVVGDFGISYRDTDERLTATMEAVAPRWFGAPELRNGYVENPTKSADVYSLGKLLHWMFTGNVYDREEQEYGQNAVAAALDPTLAAYWFIDEFVGVTVRYDPRDRKIPDAKDFASVTRQIMNRIKAGGHVLNLDVPQRCVFCGLGFYRPAHEITRLTNHLVPRENWPTIETRRNPPPKNPVTQRPPIYAGLMDVAEAMIANKRGIPLLLVCDYCGNVQYFRLDLTPDGRGGNWRP